MITNMNSQDSCPLLMLVSSFPNVEVSLTVRLQTHFSLISLLLVVDTLITVIGDSSFS